MPGEIFRSRRAVTVTTPKESLSRRRNHFTSIELRMAQDLITHPVDSVQGIGQDQLATPTQYCLGEVAAYLTSNNV